MDFEDFLATYPDTAKITHDEYRDQFTGVDAYSLVHCVERDLWMLRGIVKIIKSIFGQEDELKRRKVRDN